MTRPFVMVAAVRDIQELADRFRLTAIELRQEASTNRLWNRFSSVKNRKRIEADVWEHAASILESTIIINKQGTND